jgi:hypothetical protein
MRVTLRAGRLVQPGGGIQAILAGPSRPQKGVSPDWLASDESADGSTGSVAGQSAVSAVMSAPSAVSRAAIDA